MPSKKELDAQAWDWAKHTDPRDVTERDVKQAYRLHLKPCKQGQCRRNCRGNPYCLNCIGEREWLGEIDDSKWHDIDDPEEERRKKNNFVGLKNLGATCYVNSLLQVWFHNACFRSAIYAWTDVDRERHSQSVTPSTSETSQAGTVYTLQPCADTDSSTGAASECTVSSDNQSSSSLDQSAPSTSRSCDVSSCFSSEQYVTSSSSPARRRLLDLANEKLRLHMPSSICGRLQLIFALLQQSNRGYVDPTPLVSSLGIDAGQQQDAQEFSKLFISLLEDTLSRDPDPRVSRVIQDHFSGEYDYVTRCGACHTCSKRGSKFYELDLNIKGHKELRECIAEFLKEEKLEGENQYFCNQCNSKQNATRKIRLCSLPPVLNLQLLRFVFERNSGHKKKLNTFIQFPVVLDMSTYLDQPDQSILYDLYAVLLHRGPSAYSGHYVAHIKDSSSGTWYMFNDEEIEKMAGRDLQLGNEDDMTDKSCNKPKATKGFHCSRNSYMLVYHRRGYAVQGAHIEIPNHLMQYVRQDNEQFEQWVTEMKAMRDKSVECGRARQALVRDIYERLPVPQGDEFEWISGDWLSKWLHDPEQAKHVDNIKFLCPHNRLDPDKVSEVKCINKDVASELYQQYGFTMRLDNTSLCEECVRLRCRLIRVEARLEEDSKVIGQALKSKQNVICGYWVCKRSLRSWKKLARKELPDGEVKSTTVDSNGLHCYGSQGSSNHDDSECNDDNLVFNQDLLCDHSGLSTDSKSRVVVSDDVWRRLKFYFPKSPEFRSDAAICCKCQYADMESQQTKDLNKMVAQDQKMALLELYQAKNRPSWRNDETTVNVVSTMFVEEWRKFIREPLRRELVCDVSNCSLLCPHGKLMFDPQLMCVEQMEDRVTLIWPSEWQAMTRLFNCDVEIQISRVVLEDDQVTLVCDPDVCESCLSARLQQEHEARLDYTDAVVFVRKVVSRLAQTEQQVPTDSDKDDPEFTQGPSAKKKKKLDNDSLKVSETSVPSRRSSRHKRIRGEKEVKVSSKQTLRDFKLQLMKEFGCPPMDQHIMIDNVELVGDKETLGSLKIMPETIIYLKVDEPATEGILLEDVAQASCPEEGFKGTGLLGTMARL